MHTLTITPSPANSSLDRGQGGVAHHHNLLLTSTNWGEAPDSAFRGRGSLTPNRRIHQGFFQALLAKFVHGLVFGAGGDFAKDFA